MAGQWLRIRTGASPREPTTSHEEGPEPREGAEDTERELLFCVVNSAGPGGYSRLGISSGYYLYAIYYLLRNEFDGARLPDRLADCPPLPREVVARFLHMSMPKVRENGSNPQEAAAAVYVGDVNL